jgi:hypothetical protein
MNTRSSDDRERSRLLAIAMASMSLTADVPISAAITRRYHQSSGSSRNEVGCPWITTCRAGTRRIGETSLSGYYIRGGTLAPSQPESILSSLIQYRRAACAVTPPGKTGNLLIINLIAWTGTHATTIVYIDPAAYLSVSRRSPISPPMRALPSSMRSSSRSAPSS